MRADEAKPLREAAEQAAAWCLQKLDERVAGSGRGFSYSEAERLALHVAHSIAMSEAARLRSVAAS